VGVVDEAAFVYDSGKMALVKSYLHCQVSLH